MAWLTVLCFAEDVVGFAPSPPSHVGLGPRAVLPALRPRLLAVSHATPAEAETVDAAWEAELATWLAFQASVAAGGRAP